MAKHFNPAEITPDKAHGYKLRQVLETMRHYGFIMSYNGNQHIQFRHRDYKNIFALLAEEGLNGEPSHLFTDARPLTISNHSGEVTAISVQKAAMACLKVKELNRRLREAEDLDPLPDWVESVLKEYFADKEIDLSVEDNEIRLSREPKGDVRRSFRITCKNNVLQVVNNNFPEEFSFRFNLHKQSNPEKVFRQLFAGWDESVKAHIQLRSESYEHQIQDLRRTFGFEVDKEAGDAEALALLRFSHPAMPDLAFELPVVESFETIPQESIDTLKDIETKAYALCEQMSDLLDGLGQDKNFTQQEVTSNINKQVRRITHTSSGEKIDCPLYGELGCFDINKVLSFIEKNKASEQVNADGPSAIISGTKNHAPPPFQAGRLYW